MHSCPRCGRCSRSEVHLKRFLPPPLGNEGGDLRGIIYEKSNKDGNLCHYGYDLPVLFIGLVWGLIIAIILLLSWQSWVTHPFPHQYSEDGPSEALRHRDGTASSCVGHRHLNPLRTDSNRRGIIPSIILFLKTDLSHLLIHPIG